MPAQTVPNQHTKSTWHQEALAAITVAMLAIPQSIAFAIIAGVPPQYGLYTAVFGGILGSLLLRTPHLSVGPTNTMSLLVYGSVAAIGGSPEQRIQTAISLTFLVGIVQLLMGTLRLGDLTRYVSHSVVVGFSAGVGILIMAGQFAPMLGLQHANTDSPWFGLIRTTHRLTQADGSPLPASIIVGLITVILILVIQRLAKWLPSYLIALVCATATVAMLGLGANHIGLVGEIASAFPAPTLPHHFLPNNFELNTLFTMLAPALAIAIVGLIDTVSISKTTSPIDAPRMNANRELVGLGITNAIGGFLSCIPSSASYSRTALNTQAGAKTRWAGVTTAVLVGLGMFWLAPLAQRIPTPAIAAVLVVVGIKLVNLSYISRIRESNRADYRACLGTLLATLLLPLHIAVLVGTLLSMALYIRQARRVNLTRICTASGEYQENEEFFEQPLQEMEGNEIIVLQAEGDLFFAAAEELEQELDSVLLCNCKVVILRLRRAHTLDATVMRVIEHFAIRLKEQDATLILCGVRKRMAERMTLFKLNKTISPENIYQTHENSYDSLRDAIKKAHTLVNKAN